MAKVKKVVKLSEREQILEQLRVVKQKKVEMLRLKDEYVSTHLWEYFKPFKWQDRALDAIRNKLIVLAPASNKIGKSALAVNVICSWLKGYEAWNEVDADYPNAVKAGAKYYKPSSLDIKPPVRIRLTGEDWNVHLGQTVVPELKKWFPRDDFTTKNNTNGVPYLWTDTKTGSTLELLTHGMEDDLYESWRGHGWVPDEPPPEKKFSGMSRGLFGERGKIFIPATPLKQAWMLDKLVLSNRSDIAVIKDLCCLDNEMYYDNDDRILTEMGLSGKRTKYWHEMEGQKKEFFDWIMRWDLYTDKKEGVNTAGMDDFGATAEKYLKANTPESTHNKIMDLKFLKFAKDTPLDEKPSRFFGMFKKLVGLVVKEFDKCVHIRHVEDGDEIPTNWIVTAMIDFHLGKPQAIGFYACTEKNIHFVIDEVWENMTPEEIADLIIRKKKVNCWNISEVFIDPLSKGDTGYLKNRFEDVDDSFSIIEERLDGHGITLEVASKDKKSGFTNIKSWLRGVNGIPTLYFLDTLQSVKDDKYGHVYEIQRLCYDDKGEIEKVNDHFMENLYRYTLVGVEYHERKERYCHELVGSTHNTSESWMGA